MAHAHSLDQPFAMGPKMANGKFAMWLFLGTEILFFTALIGTYLIIRIGNPGLWPEKGPGEVLNIMVTAVNTFILICSSVTMVKAFEAISQGDQKKLRIYLVATALIGALFVSVQVFEYSELIHEGFVPKAGMFAATFYVMTGFHGMHVAGGVIAITCVAIQAFRGRYTKEDHFSVEGVGLYWHFVDLVWIILFTVVYLV